MEKQIKKRKKSSADWSKMCIDIMQLILERLPFSVFHRARSVCSSWYTISKSCAQGTRNRYPWLIIFPEKKSQSCTLYDPIEDKTYKTKDLGVELSSSSCIASYGNWLLMLNHKLEFWILNVFSSERINLPSLSLRGEVSFVRTKNGGVVLVDTREDRDPMFLDREMIFHTNIETGLLWFDEKSKDFVVGWIYCNRYLFTYKKGDVSWWHFQGTSCMSMAYKDQKLYVHTWTDYIRVLDFSGDVPKMLVGGTPFWQLFQPEGYAWEKRIAVTKSGDVVMVVLSLKEFNEDQEGPTFSVFKVNREGTEWERVDSLGHNEVLVFGDGVTLGVDDGGGIRKSSLVYFLVDDVWPTRTHDTIFQSCACVFDLKTAELTWSRFPYCSSKHRWFVPGSDQR